MDKAVLTDRNRTPTDEIVYALVMADGGRVHARLGGLTKEQVKVHDGQR